MAALKFDGLDNAIVGVAGRCGQPDLLVYDYEKIVRTLMRRDSMVAEDAIEYVDFNIAGAWVGEGTPLILHKMPPKEALAYFDSLEDGNEMDS